MQRTVLCLMLFVTPVLAQEPPKADEPHTVVRGLIKVEVELDGVVEAEKMWPVEVKLKAWQSQSLEIVDPIAAGASVKAGDTLVTFKTEELDRAIRDAELAEAAAKVGLETARHELALMERSVAIDTLAARLAAERAEQDLEHFVNVTRALSEKLAADRLKQMEHNLEYVGEELRQLEKMYREDELTEETEEIILKRQKRQVEFARNNLAQSQEYYDLTVRQSLPRREQDLESAVNKAKVELARAEATLPLKLEVSRQAVAKAELAHQDAAKKLRELRADRDLLTVRSPGDGLVYYGRNERGKWLDAAAVSTSMKPGGTIRPGTVFLTIVAPRPLFARADVPEPHILRLDESDTGWLTLTAAPFDAIPVTIESIAPLSTAPNQYELVASFAQDAVTERLAPGLTGKLKFIAYEKADAVKVSLAAVKSDAPGQSHVFVKAAGGAYQRRTIKLGQRTATEAEVLEGLAEGEQVHPKGEPEKGQ